MTPRTVRKLSDLEIDEISVVDRPANQHGLVAIAKRDEGLGMTLWDAQGNEVFEDELEHGMVVYTDDDEPMVYVEDGQPELDLSELGVEIPDDASQLQDELAELQETSPALAKALGITSEFGKSRFGAVSNVRNTIEEYRAAGGAGARMSRAARNGPGRAARVGGRLARQSDVRTGAAFASGAGGAGGYAAGRRRKGGMSKSFGDGIYESLSKAMNAEDARDALRGVADEIGEMLQQSQMAALSSYQIAKALAEEREDETWMQVAQGYELPVDPRQFGGILKRAGRALPPADVAALDRIFKAAGEAQYFTEQGANGQMTGGVHDMMEAAAMELVGKNAGTTKEQAVTALYAANPQAYDDYLAEQAGLF